MSRLRLAAATLVCTCAVAGPGAAAQTRAPAASTHTLTLQAVTIKAVWKESWLTGSVRFAGTVGAANPEPVDLVVVLRPLDRVGPPAGTATIALTAPGAFSDTIALPRRLLPGRYQLTVSGRAGGSHVLPTVTRDVRNPAPPEGVVDLAVASSRKGGPKVNTVRGPRRELWARFRFVVPPRSKTVRVAWYSPDFKWYGIAKKPYKSTVETYVRTEAALMKGVWFCFASVNGRYVKRARIRIS